MTLIYCAYTYIVYYDVFDVMQIIRIWSKVVMKIKWITKLTFCYNRVFLNITLYANISHWEKILIFKVWFDLYL